MKFRKERDEVAELFAGKGGDTCIVGYVATI